MSEGQIELRCEPCQRIFPAALAGRNRWGDPCCPECGGVRLLRHRSRLAAVVATYFLFNVF